MSADHPESVREMLNALRTCEAQLLTERTRAAQLSAGLRRRVSQSAPWLLVGGGLLTGLLVGRRQFIPAALATLQVLTGPLAALYQSWTTPPKP